MKTIIEYDGKFYLAESPNPYWHDTIFNSLKQLRMELKAL